MMQNLPPQRRRILLATLSALFWTVAFAVAYTRWPLYSENQNTKFLHGLSWAGVGALDQDWLAQTIDPLPAFSLVVYLTARFLHPSLFYLFQALLLGTYLLSVVGIADSVYGLKKTVSGPILFSVILIALHSSLIWPFSQPALGTSIGWLLQAGVANQYLFNPVFQPASFGVLLVLSIALFLHGHPYWAAAAAALAGLFHSTYLPSAAILTAAYVVMTWAEERKLLRALAIGGLALAIVAPALIYNGLTLGPTSPEAWTRAQDIIVNDRIPHHSLPEIWFDRTVTVKSAIVLLALIAVRRSRLFPILLLCALSATVLTWLQVRNPSDLLAFVAPWRISVFLVPLSTGLLIAWAVAGICNRYAVWVNRYQALLVALSAVVLVIVVGRGAQSTQQSFAARESDGYGPLYDFVQATPQPGSVYLTPVYMAEFRLATGQPVVVTWKSHPYKDVEVIEWKARVDAVNSFYAEPTCDHAADLANRYGATHFLFEGTPALAECDWSAPVYQDDRFTIIAARSIGREDGHGSMAWLSAPRPPMLGEVLPTSSEVALVRRLLSGMMEYRQVSERGLTLPGRLRRPGGPSPPGGEGREASWTEAKQGEADCCSIAAKIWVKLKMLGEAGLAGPLPPAVPPKVGGLGGLSPLAALSGSAPEFTRLPL